MDVSHVQSSLGPDADPALADDDRSLGQAVRDARKARRLSLKQVAESAGISLGLLSQIERGISSPSVRALRAICAVLDISIHALFGGAASAEPENPHVTRRDRRRVVNFGSKGFIKEFLTAHDGGALQAMEIIMEPGGQSGENPYNHEGEECGVVLDGTLELLIDGNVHTLRAGDSFHFESTLPHGFRNIHSGITRVLWVTTPPVW